MKPRAELALLLAVTMTGPSMAAQGVVDAPRAESPPTRGVESDDAAVQFDPDASPAPAEARWRVS